jgi:pimeloyl-ACP methyl ester carboxylesterase
MPSVSSASVRIYWEEEGRGDPLLLIMGTGYTLEMWHRVRPLLARTHRLLFMDNRGVGRSDVPDEPYSISDMAADCVGVLDAAGAADAHVLGAWLGGAVAQELALSHRERVRSLVLVCTTAFPHTADPEPEVLEYVRTRASMSKEEGARAGVPFTYDESTPRSRIEEDLKLRLKTYPSAEGYLGQLRAVSAYESRSRIGFLSIPTLVAHGENDRLVPPSNGEDLARLIPDAELVMIPGAGHNVFTDQPETTAEVILTFLDHLSR